METRDRREVVVPSLLLHILDMALNIPGSKDIVDDGFVAQAPEGMATGLMLNGASCVLGVRTVAGRTDGDRSIGVVGHARISIAIGHQDDDRLGQLAACHRRVLDGREFVLDTREIKAVLGEVPLDNPDVTEWLKGYIDENVNNLYGGVQ